MARPGLLQRASHCRYFMLAADEPGQSAPRGKLEMRAQRPGTHHFVHLNRGIEPFHRRRSQRPKFEIALA